MRGALEILSEHFIEVDTAPRARGHRAATDSGVYLLVKSSAIVYVGSGRYVRARVLDHASQRVRLSAIGVAFGTKDFDRALWLHLPLSVVDSYEGALIRHLAPVHNVTAPATKAHDAEILFGLGLRDSLDESEVAWEGVA